MMDGRRWLISTGRISSSSSSSSSGWSSSAAYYRSRQRDEEPADVICRQIYRIRRFLYICLSFNGDDEPDDLTWVKRSCPSSAQCANVMMMISRSTQTYVDVMFKHSSNRSLETSTRKWTEYIRCILKLLSVNVYIVFGHICDLFWSNLCFRVLFFGPRLNG